MKKILIIATAILLVFALAACAAKKAEPEESSENTNVANPWTDVETAEEAADGAGVGYFMVPEENTETGGGIVNVTGFRDMKELAQADGYIGTAELTIRKGLKQNSKDVSGDYTEYKYEWEADLDGMPVRCFGNEEGKTMKAIWLSDNFSYSIFVRGQGDIYDTYGLDLETTLEVASAVQ